MNITEAFNNIPELAHLDEITFFKDCEAVLKSSNKVQALRTLGDTSGLGPFISQPGPATAQENGDLRALPLIRRIRIEPRLQVHPGQRITKHIRIAWYIESLDQCIGIDIHIPIQFFGYGSYTLSHYDSATNIDPVNHFFNTLRTNHFNFHRTFIFTGGTYEIHSQPAVPLLIIDPADKTQSTVNPAFLKNLERLATAARSRNIILQLCLFPFHSISGNAYMPLPQGLTSADLGGTGYQPISRFCKVNGPWQALQNRIIDSITTTLMSHWNIVYEVGNELRVPSPTAQYNEAHLRDWVNATADRIGRKTYGKLVTTSGVPHNESLQCPLSSLDFLSFHYGQWKNSIESARNRAAGLYSDKHLTIDDDGAADGEREIQSNLRRWAIEALSEGGIGPCSFNHKGKYNPTDKSFSEDSQDLATLKAAWEAVFQPVRPGINIYIPKPIHTIQI